MTDAELFAQALRGGEDTEQLYVVCLERPRAEALARFLEENATQADDAAKAWAQVLEEWHPGLKVSLRPAAPA